MSVTTETVPAVLCYDGPLDRQAFTLTDWQEKVAAAHAMRAAAPASPGQPALWYEPAGLVPAEHLPLITRDRKAITYAAAGFGPVHGARWVGGAWLLPRGSHWRDHEHEGDH